MKRNEDIASLFQKLCSRLDDWLVTFIEPDIFAEVDEDDIIETFIASRNRRSDKNKRNHKTLVGM